MMYHILVSCVIFKCCIPFLESPVRKLWTITNESDSALSLQLSHSSNIDRSSFITSIHYFISNNTTLRFIIQINNTWHLAYTVRPWFSPWGLLLSVSKFDIGTYSRGNFSRGKGILETPNLWWFFQTTHLFCITLFL